MTTQYSWPQNLALILLAGGSGTRFSNQLDKILTLIEGKPLLSYALNAFLGIGKLSTLCIVVRDDAQKKRIKKEVIEKSSHSFPSLLWVMGGPTRQASVYNALKVLSKKAPQWVLIHDGARPCITPRSIDALLSALAKYPAATLAKRMHDSLKRLPEEASFGQLELVDRRGLWTTETPQGFSYPLILDAHHEAQGHETDDVSIASKAGHSIALIEHPDPNPKLTTTADLPLIHFLLTRAHSS